jgi:hypothetical protein
MSLDEHGFWASVELMDRAAFAQGDEAGAVAPIVAALEAGPVDDIFAFEEYLARFLCALDGQRYAERSPRLPDGWIGASICLPMPGLFLFGAAAGRWSASVLCSECSW